MTARKSVLKPAPPRPELARLLAASVAAGVTDEMFQEQRVSFAYGNAPEGARITKESVREAARNPRINRR